MKPPAQLAGYIRFFWFIEGNIPYIHHAFAYPCPELIFCYKGQFHHGLGTGTDNICTTGLFGQADTPGRVTVKQEDFGIFGAYLYPHTLPQLLCLPASAITNQQADLRSLLGKEGAILEEKVMIAPDNRQRADIVCEFLQVRLKFARSEHAAMTASIRSLINSYQAATVKDLAASNFLSVRQFERRFRDLSGFSPKLFMRIMRFNSVLNRNFRQRSLTEIGIECGYYDQSHFIRDFRQFSGYSLTEYFKKETLAAADRGTVEFS